MKNHSQLVDLRLPEEVVFNRRVGRNPSNPPGIETPLGHSYSLVLEALANAGIDATPRPAEFLDSVRGSLSRRGMEYEAVKISMESPSFYPLEARAINEYMKQKGVSQGSREKVMKDIVGFGLDVF